MERTEQVMQNDAAMRWLLYGAYKDLQFVRSNDAELVKMKRDMEELLVERNLTLQRRGRHVDQLIRQAQEWLYRHRQEKKR